MKKVLIATTALVLSGGLAAAEVTLSGDGRMGMVYDGSDMQFTSRARATFTLTGESDTGLSFGGSFRADNAGNAASGSAGNIWVSGAYGRLTMGDINSAAENAVGDLHGVGLTGLQDLNEMNYLASSLHGPIPVRVRNADDDGWNNIVTGNPGALYQYAIGDTTLYASMYDGKGTAANPEATYDAWSLGARHSMGDFAAGLGWERVSVDGARADHWILGGDANFGDATVRGIYGRASLPGDVRYTQYGLSGRYNAGLTTVTGFWKRDDWRDGPRFDTFGIGGEYDLGGGAAFAAGIVDSDYNADIIADMGIKFRF
ncbi:MAG: porin [Paracoccus sp. (in: a-proteobacteria)]|nr:porin [Paracoccus sp. (in: a-proteobacteria)]